MDKATPYTVVRSGAKCHKCGQRFDWRWFYIHAGSCDTDMVPTQYPFMGDFHDS